MSLTNVNVYVNALSVLAPGLAGWREAAVVLAGEEDYAEQPLPPFPKNLLPPNERRRATNTMKLVLQVADAVMQDGGYNARQVHSVFASSAGDAEIIDKICTALATPGRPVSPTHFHNSVHNAPAGYWSIGSGCRLPSISLSAHDGSFSAGLLVAYDHPLPEPLAAVRRLSAPFAVALLLTVVADAASLARLTLNLLPRQRLAETRLADPALERLRAGNPAARSLPLLAALGRAQPGQTLKETVVLPYLDSRDLRVVIERVQQ